MKKTFFTLFIMPGLIFSSCGPTAGNTAGDGADSLANDSATAAADSSKPEAAPAVSEADKALVMDFLNELYVNKSFDIFADEWVHKYCSEKMQKKLHDEYDYDGEGWASWIIGGWGDGLDLETEVTGITSEGNNYFVTMVATGYSTDYVKGEQVLRLTINVIDGVPVIDDCVKTKHFEMVE